MPFDAGSIVARLDLDEQEFNRKLAAAERKTKQFEKDPIRLKTAEIFNQSTTAKARKVFADMDNQLSRDAMSRMRSGNGSLLGTLMSIVSPRQLPGAPSAQQSASQGLLGRIFGGVGGGGGASFGGGPGSTGGNGNQGLGTGLFKGIGPGILGLGTRGSLIAGLGGIAGATLPALAGSLGALGIGGAGLGLAGSLGSQAISGITPLLSQQSQAQQALAAATTPQQIAAAKAQLAGIQQALAQQPKALQSIFGSLSKLQSGWQKFTASLAPALVQPIALISKAFTELQGPIRQAFTGAMTLIDPFIKGITDVGKMILPLLGQAFRAAAPLMQPLIDGLGKLVAGILPGLTTLLKASAPAVKAFSGVLATIGSGVGKMLADFAPAVKASSVVLTAVGKVIGGLFPVIGQLAGVLARTLAPIFVQLASVIRALEPTLVIVGKVFAALAGAILGDLVSAFTALAQLLVDIQPAIQIFATALSQVFKVLENSGVFAILGDALEAIVPILAKLINTLVAQLAPILPILITLLAKFSTILVDLLAAGLTTILTGITDLLTQFKFLVPLLGIITAAWLAWDLVMAANPIGAIIIAIVALIGGITLLAKHWGQVWGDIKNWAEDAWKFIWDGFGKYLLPLLGPVGLIALGAIEMAKHWSQVTGAMQSAGQNLWQWLWNDFGAKILGFFTKTIPGWWDDFLGLTKRNLWGSLKNGFTDLLNWVHDNVDVPIERIFTHDIPSIWDDFIGFTNRRLIQPVQSGLGGMVSWINHNVVQPVSNFFTQTLPNAFRTFVSIVGTVMQRIEGAVKTPVNWVITHVLDGLIGAFDWISGKVGGPHINKIPGLAAGGRIPGYGGGDSHLAMLEPGEAVVPKHHANSPAFAAWANAVGIPGYAGGGRVGQRPPPHTGNPHLPQGQANPGQNSGLGWLGKAADLGKIMAAIATGNTTALTNAILNLIPGGTGGAVADMASLLVDIPKTLLKDAVQTLIGLGGGLGGKGGEIVKYAMSWLGQIPYVWGGTAVPGGADCSGFVQTVYRHFGIGAPRTSEQQGAWVTKAPPTPGGLAFYHSPAGGADPGHVAIVRNANQVISQGGGSGPQLIPLHALPLLWTGVPPGGGLGVKSSGPLQAYARKLLGAYGWGNQWPAFSSIVHAEDASWNPLISNPGSGAYGIPQALPGSKMASAGADWRTSGYTQLRWMMSYIKNSPNFSDPDQAWAFHLAHGWYDKGGWLMPGPMNGTGQPEAVLTPPQSSAYMAMAEAARLAAQNGGGSPRLEALLERVIAAVDRNAAATGASVGQAINGGARSAFYGAQYSSSGV